MSQVVATSLTTGTSLALFWKLLEGASTGPHQALFCPTPSPFVLHWFSLLVGIVIGLVLGPVIEALVWLRVALYQAVIRRVFAAPGGHQPPRPLYRLL